MCVAPLMRPIRGETKPKTLHFLWRNHAQILSKTLPKHCPNPDYHAQNPKNDQMNSTHSFGHNSLYTSQNDLKFIPFESLDIGL